MQHSPHATTAPGRPGAPADDPAAFRAGVVYATAGFLWWGASPIYWKAVGTVAADELVAHRALWSTVLLAVLLIWRRRGGEVRAVLADRRAVATLGVTTLLIAVNWLTYIWAMGHARVLEASLGYYINPLVNVLLGIVVLGERLRRAQAAAVALAAVGVSVLTWEVGRVPWVALLLAGTFGLYGLLRKTVKAGPEVGLAAETTLLAPFAVAWLWHLSAEGQAVFPAAGPWVQTLVVLSGVITVLPLVWFTHGARRLPLGTVGLLQYLSPTGQFLLAVLVFREPFSRLHLAAFACIWAGLAIFTWDLRSRMRRPATAP
jgi:chloramphenicol-sensitive protein RarD